MRIIEAINRLDSLKFNTYSQPDKVEWLSRLDSMVKKQIIDTHEGAEAVSFSGYTDQTPMDTVLLVPAPYDEIYLRWLEAQIDYHNGEYDKYNNAIIMFNAAFEAYSKPLVVPISDENAIRCYRSDGNGVRVGNSTSVWIKAKRTFYPVSGKNTCALQWRSKLTTEQWNDEAHLWSDLIANTATSTDQYDSLLAGKTFKLTQSYTVQVRVIDDVGETDIKTFEIPTRDVALHLGRGGKNVTIGTYCDYSEERTFHCVYISAILGVAVLLWKLFRDQAKIREGQKCQLRTAMLSTYHNHKEKKQLRQYEAENFVLMYQAYKAMGGNSFIDEIYEHVSKWDVET